MSGWQDTEVQTGSSIIDRATAGPCKKLINKNIIGQSTTDLIKKVL